MSAVVTLARCVEYGAMHYSQQGERMRAHKQAPCKCKQRGSRAVSVFSFVTIVFRAETLSARFTGGKGHHFTPVFRGHDAKERPFLGKSSRTRANVLSRSCRKSLREIPRAQMTQTEDSLRP